MSDLVLNGTTFNGSPFGGSASAWRPTGIALGEEKIGLTLVAASGKRNRVERSVVKRYWTIDWQKTNQATMQTIRTIQRLMTTFTLVDLEGASYTVQTEEAFEPEFAFTDEAGAHYWNVTLKVYQQ